jgi:hypothetical protein
MTKSARVYGGNSDFERRMIDDLAGDGIERAPGGGSDGRAERIRDSTPEGTHDL